MCLLLKEWTFFFFCLQSCVTKIFLHAEAQGTEPSHLERERERGRNEKKEISRTVRLHPNKCWGAADSPSQ